MNRTPRAVATAALAVAALAAVAGCGSSASSGAASSTTPTQAAATTGPAVTSPAVTPGGTTTSPPPLVSVSIPPSVPTLGQVAGDFAHGTGFGQVRPPVIDNGGDPTGIVTKITWKSWGGSTATGAGSGIYVSGDEPVADGTPQSVTVVAFKLGICDGRKMYQAVEWYFPQHGQSFSSTHYEDICTGTYVPGS